MTRWCRLDKLTTKAQWVGDLAYIEINPRGLVATDSIVNRFATAELGHSNKKM